MKRLVKILRTYCDLKIYFVRITIPFNKYYVYEYEFNIFGHKFKGEFFSERYLGVFDGDKWRGLVECEESC